MKKRESQLELQTSTAAFWSSYSEWSKRNLRKKPKEEVSLQHCRAGYLKKKPKTSRQIGTKACSFVAKTENPTKKCKSTQTNWSLALNPQHPEETHAKQSQRCANPRKQEFNQASQEANQTSQEKEPISHQKPQNHLKNSKRSPKRLQKHTIYIPLSQFVRPCKSKSKRTIKKKKGREERSKKWRTRSLCNAACTGASKRLTDQDSLEAKKDLAKSARTRADLLLRRKTQQRSNVRRSNAKARQL